MPGCQDGYIATTAREKVPGRLSIETTRNGKLWNSLLHGMTTWTPSGTGTNENAGVLLDVC